MAYGTATLTGTYKTFDNQPASGVVEIIPNSRQLIDAEGNEILAGRVKVTLDEAGSFTVTLPATDDGTVEPATGRQYTVVAKLRHTHLAAVTGIELATGTTADIADFAAQPAVDATVSNAATTAQLAALEATIPTGLLPASNGTDDTTAIQAVLDAHAGQTVIGRDGESYLTSAPLVVAAGTTLDMTGCTVTLLAGSECNLLQNTAAVVAPATRDAGIHIIGGTWDKGGNSGTAALDRHIFRLRRADRLTIEGCRFLSTNGKFAVSLGDVTDYRCENLTFDTSSDGVHVQGPAARGVIRSMFGTTGDDLVAVTPRDWTGYDDTYGDVTDLTIDDLHAANVEQVVVKVLGSPSGAARRIRIRNVYGTCLSTVGAVWVGDDSAQANTTGGVIDDVTIENVSAITTAANTVISLPGTNLRRIRIRGVHLPEHKKAVNLAPNAAGTCTDLRIEDISLAQATVMDLHLIEANANMTISKMLVSGVTIGSATQRLNIVAFAKTITDLVISDVTASLVSGSQIAYLNSASSSCTRLTVSNCNVVGTGGSLVGSPFAGAVLTGLQFTACAFAGTAWIADLNTTTAVSFSAVKCTNLTNGTFNIRASGNVTVRAAALDTNISAAVKAVGGVLKSRDLGYPIDVATLDKTNGDMAYNTNAARSCGVGPVVCDGTNWKHLFTGATY